MIEKIKLALGAFFGILTVVVGWLTGIITLLVASLYTFKYFMATEKIVSSILVFIGVGGLTVVACLLLFVVCGFIATILLKDA